jgi:hypothetical protein
MGLTAVQFREQYDGEGMLDHFRAVLVTPYVAALRELRPLTSTWNIPVGRARAAP